MPRPDLVIRDNPDKHRFETDLGDGSVAIAEYTLPKGKIVFPTRKCRPRTRVRVSALR
jgi:hypothetical protein